MEQMITMSINIHLFMIVATVLLGLYMVFITNSLKDEMLYINRIKYILPQYLALVAAIAFTGITVMAVNHFVFKISLVLMIFAVIFIFFTSTKLHMLRKNTNTTNQNEMEYFRSFVKKKYLVDTLLIFVVGSISFFLK